MNRKIIEVKDLVKRYKKATENAVDGVSFYVEEGALFSLLGPNGAGKTTTVSMLTTILSKTSGALMIDGYDVEKEAAKVRKQIGVIFQNPSLDQNLTAEENIRFHANLYGLYSYRPTFSMMPADYKETVSRLTQVLEIDKEIHKPVKTFSGGMKRKLEIVRSLMHRPKVLFLDEPTTGLDPVSRTNLWKYLRQVQKEEKTTIFLTTHYLEEAEESDYICVMNKGRVVSRGTPDEIKSELVEAYVEVEAGERKKLEAELKNRAFHYEGNGPFRIHLNGITPAEIIQGMKTPLTHVEIHNPTLEEAYVKIVEGGEKV